MHAPTLPKRSTWHHICLIFSNMGEYVAETAVVGCSLTRGVAHDNQLLLRECGMTLG